MKIFRSFPPQGQEEVAMSPRKLSAVFGLGLAAALMPHLWATAPSSLGSAPAHNWNQDLSVYQRRIHPREPATGIDWNSRISQLLQQEPGDLVITAVGDLILNVPISGQREPERQQLYRLLQESDLTYGNLEFSINEHPEEQGPFYNFRADKSFGWELAALGFNLVGLANNHTFDFGTKGLKDCLQTLDMSHITHAGAGLTLEDAHDPGIQSVQGQKQKVALLSYMRFWSARFRSRDASGPSVATLNPATILVAQNGKVEAVEGVQEDDILTMEDNIIQAKRRGHLVIVALHNHDVSHNRAFGIQDTTPPNDEIMYRRAVEAGADLVLGSGPHVLRGLELHQGKPIFFSLGNFIYQYRTPDRIPVDLPHQRDPEMPKGLNVSVWDRRESPEIMETLVARIVMNGGKPRKIQLIPVLIDDEGPQYGVPRLVSDARARQILDRVRHLSEPYGTRMVDKQWYAEVILPEGKK